VGALPYEVRNWVGLYGSLGRFDETIYDGNRSGSYLIELNDILKWDFKQIAEFIKSEPKGLFIDLEEVK
jgi:hypothetical protein